MIANVPEAFTAALLSIDSIMAAKLGRIYLCWSSFKGSLNNRNILSLPTSVSKMAPRTYDAFPAMLKRNLRKILTQFQSNFETNKE